MRKSIRWGVMTALVAAAVAGCGGDDDPGAANVPSSSADAAAEPVDEGAAADGAPEGWATVTDSRTGISVALPESVEPQDIPVPMPDGSTVTGRAYIVESTDGAVGFNVYEGLPPEDYSLQVGIAGVAEGMSGVLEDSNLIDVKGYEAIEGEISFSQGLGFVQIVLLEEDVMSFLSLGPEADRDEVHAKLQQVVESAELG